MFLHCVQCDDLIILLEVEIVLNDNFIDSNIISNIVTGNNIYTQVHILLYGLINDSNGTSKRSLHWLMKLLRYITAYITMYVYMHKGIVQVKNISFRKIFITSYFIVLGIGM